LPSGLYHNSPGTRAGAAVVMRPCRDPAKEA
jgi:hypothetical protein